ncbi:hypothetical protein ACWEKT_02690 [Nocardia takedensis]
MLAELSPASGADGKLEDFSNVTAADLSAVLQEAHECIAIGTAKDPDTKLSITYYPNAVGIFRSRWAANYPDPDDMLIMMVRQGRFEFNAYIVLPKQSDYDDRSIRSVFEPALAPSGMECTETRFYQGGQEGPSCELTILPPKTATVREMAYILSFLRDIVMNEPIPASPEDAFELIRLGAVQSLLGVAESETVEIKREHFPHTIHGQVKFAVEVASFANSKNGGLVIIGARTVTDVQRRDVIAEIGGSEIDPDAELRYRTAMDSLIYPEIDDVKMCRTKSALGEVFAILIPPQQRDRMPFIVRGGSAADGRTNASTFQVPIRRGGHIGWMRIEEIHRYLRSTENSVEYYIFKQEQSNETD